MGYLACSFMLQVLPCPRDLPRVGRYWAVREELDVVKAVQIYAFGIGNLEHLKQRLHGFDISKVLFNPSEITAAIRFPSQKASKARFHEPNQIQHAISKGVTHGREDLFSG